MKESKFYDNKFYADQGTGSYNSAKKILPLVNDIIHPGSVIDIGCGKGYWLKVWQTEMNISDLLGVEGDYVTPESFELDSKFLLNADLKTSFNLPRRFDLVMSMEVAEHIPEDCADIFVQNLVNAGDIILFSAAIKGQLGTYHINEQMPEYWAEKFQQHGYRVVDLLRPKIWNDPSIEYWYRQNSLLFIKSERLQDFPVLERAAEITDPEYLTRIHPEKYFAYVKQNEELNSTIGFIKHKLYLLKMKIKGNKA